MVHRLPPLEGGLFLSDGGLETTLVFLDGVELPHFAAFPLLADAAGRERLRGYYRPYLELAADTPGAGFVLETPTWRANPDWGAALGYAAAALTAANADAVHLIAALRDEWQPRIDGPVLLSGIVGPRGDGYVASAPDSAAAAATYHGAQVRALAGAGADLVAAVTMTTVAEARGVARAAAAAGLPCVVSFTVEIDGRLPSGESLAEAISALDAEPDPPAYFQINCAHPSHFDAVLHSGGPWRERVRALRANASMRSHAELDAATELDIGDPADLGERYLGLRAGLPQLGVLGGCCGTDIRHLRAIRDAWLRAT